MRTLVKKIKNSGFTLKIIFTCICLGKVINNFIVIFLDTFVKNLKLDQIENWSQIENYQKI